MALSMTRSLIVLGVLATGVSLALLGCANGGGPTTAPATTGPANATGKSGAQLWAENCGRCHNVRSPGSYSPDQWQVAVHDMRVRANLTGEEQRKITEFLKAAAQ